MRLDDLDYFLPGHLIAQQPASDRDGSRLLVVRRGGEVVDHRIFRDLPGLLEPGDLLLMNNTRVLAARLIGRRSRTGGKWEGLYLHDTPDGRWKMLCQIGGRPVNGETILVEAEIGGELLHLKLIERTPEGHWLMSPDSAGSTHELLTRFGRIPLPPYIRKGRAETADRERYQTIYADRAGAVAAPTAGLHFTPQVLDALKQRGIEHAFVTLHVGAGTFQPVQVENPAEHRVQPEWGEISAEVASAVAKCKARGNRVVAVGTTTVRVLETAALHGTGQAWSGFTELTVCPPFTFRVIDALVTNFHLPRSSLLMLVAAFTGLESLRAAYKLAVEQEYRFYSYGDAMLII